MCDELGLEDTVEELSEPAAQWITVVCTPTGQALMPKIENNYIWLIHGTSIPFMVRSVPPGRDDVPNISGMDPNEYLRFAQFAGGEMSGQRKDMAMTLLNMSLDGEALPEINSVYQLDARATFQGLITNLFIYVVNNRPDLIVACRERCQKSVLIDVQSFEELTSGLSEQ